MNLRCLVKTGDTWVQERPEDVTRWLWSQDSADIHAIVIDDSSRPKRYFCNTEELAATARGEGKDAATFNDLERELHEAMPPTLVDSPTRCWCQRHMIACSEWEVCGEDCGGVTFGRKEEGDEETDGVAALEDTPVLAAV